MCTNPSNKNKSTLSSRLYTCYGLALHSRQHCLLFFSVLGYKLKVKHAAHETGGPPGRNETVAYEEEQEHNIPLRANNGHNKAPADVLCLITYSFFKSLTQHEVSVVVFSLHDVLAEYSAAPADKK